MNNRDWLYSLEPSELAEWFESEHSNDALDPEKVVSETYRCSNDANSDAANRQKSWFAAQKSGENAENDATKARKRNFADSREEIFDDAVALLENVRLHGSEYTGDAEIELDTLFGRLENVVVAEWEANMASIYTDWSGIRVFGKSLFEIRGIINANRVYEEAFTSLKRMFTTESYHFRGL